jgi:formate/nitrite transporter FocA (FNT family)
VTEQQRTDAQAEDQPREQGHQGQEQPPNGKPEESVQGALKDAADKGDQRLRRGPVSLLATGVIAGIDVGIGVLAKLSVLEATGSELLGGLAFSIGFIAILLGKSELFTENFLIPVTAALRKRRSYGSLVKLWGLTGLGNLLGGWVIMAIIVAAIPRIRESDVLLETAYHFIEMGIGWEMFASAMLGGAAITMMTWMEQGTDSVGAKIVAVSGIAFVLAGTPLFHAVVSSLEMFGALQRSAAFGYIDWLGAFGVSVAGNIVGGVGLVTVLRLVQARAEPPDDPRVP